MYLKLATDADRGPLHKRDRALPGWFDHVDARFQSPIRTSEGLKVSNICSLLIHLLTRSLARGGSRLHPRASLPGFRSGVSLIHAALLTFSV